ncbi:MAG: hypothetical protein RI911_490, partial [Candidatus Parcubacteria bacterium]
QSLIPRVLPSQPAGETDGEDAVSDTPHFFDHEEGGSAHFMDPDTHS